MDNNSTSSNSTNSSTDSTDTVNGTIVSWTPIWVTLLMSGLQGIILYLFFIYQRNKASKLYHIEQDKLLSNTNTNNNNTDEATITNNTNKALEYCNIYESRQYTRSHRSPKPFSKIDMFTISNDELLRCIGLDTYMYLRLFYLGICITGCSTFLSLLLLPIYATGTAEETNSTKEFNLLTIAHVEQGTSWRLYISVVVWYIFCCIILYLFWNEWHMYYKNRTIYDATGDIDMSIVYRYTVRVEELPKHMMINNEILYNYFHQLFPNKVYETNIIMNTISLEKLITLRHKYILQLESLIASNTYTSQNPKSKQKPPKQIRIKFQKVDAKTFYESEIQRLNNEIDTIRQTYKPSNTSSSNTTNKKLPSITYFEPVLDKKSINDGEGIETGIDSIKLASTTTSTTTNKDSMNTYSNNKGTNDKNTVSDQQTQQQDNQLVPTSTAYVTFTSLRSKQAAIQCELNGNPNTILVFPAADPKYGTIWNNVTISLQHQTKYQMIASIFFIIGILFWAIPVTFITTISNLNSILDAFGLQQANPSAFWYGLVAGLLPVIMLAVLMIVLYMVITAAATSFIKYKSYPEVDSYCLYWHMLFQFANLWLILIGGSLFGQINTIISDFSINTFIETIASAMPGSSVFFVNMIILSSFNAFGMELSMIVKYVVTIIMNKISPIGSRTQRQLDDQMKPPTLNWGQKVPPVIFIFMVSILYMPIVPIISIFAFVYFVGTYIVMKHQCLHVYAQEYEGGGSATWQQVFGFLMSSLYIGEFIFIAYMGIKEAPIQSGLGFVPLIVTCYFHRVLYRTYIAPIQNLSLEVAADVDIRDGELSKDTSDDAEGTTIDQSSLYRQPALDTEQDERGPMPYRRNPTTSLSSTEAV